MDNIEFTAEFSNGKRKIPLLAMRGGSAQCFELWNCHQAEWRCLRQHPDDISTTSPKSIGGKSFPEYQTGSHGFGYSSCPGGEFFGSLMINELQKRNDRSF